MLYSSIDMHLRCLRICIMELQTRLSVMTVIYTRNCIVTQAFSDITGDLVFSRLTRVHLQ
jgi:hypothetical protein